MARQADMCAYCGCEEIPLTREHVVSRCMWGDSPLPSSVVVVPACLKCKLEYEGDEAYFRNVIAAQSDGRLESVKRLFVGGPIDRGMTKRRHIAEELVRGFKRVRRFHAESGMYRPEDAFEVDTRRVNRIVDKIVRGLFFFRNQRPLSCDYSVNVLGESDYQANPSYLAIVAHLSTSAGYGDDVFQCRSVRCETDADATVWEFRFFSSVSFLAVTSPKADPSG